MTASAKLNTAFLDVAVAGDMGIPWSLPRLIGASRAKDLSFIPRKVDAEEALRIGLVARVFADESFRTQTDAVPRRSGRSSKSASRGSPEPGR